MTSYRERVRNFTPPSTGTFWTFVYGTLRPGEGNYWIGDAVLDIFEHATTPGLMYARGIPFCNFKSKTGIITGTLLQMTTDHPLTHQMTAMELGAGYEAVDVPVKLKGDEHASIMALAWHYPGCEDWGHDRGWVQSGNFRDTHGSRHYMTDIDTDFDDEEEDIPNPRDRHWWDDI